MRITNDGSMIFCRWSDKSSGTVNIRDVDPKHFFQQSMAPVRQALLNGESLPQCSECYQMERHGKISGRERQLLKTGVRLVEFEKTMASSPWRQQWLQDYNTGTTDQLPQDWQIDLGNYCNGACVFCSPQDSTKLASEWKRIGFIDQLPPKNWTDYPELVSKFMDVLTQTPHIQYLHFIGGETVLIPAFKQILQCLIDTGLNRTAIIGFTTNLAAWDQSVVDLLTQFVGVNLGMSVEAFDPINDYVRWPANLSTVTDIRDRWIEIGKKHNWLMQFRTTPTALSVSKLVSVYEYAWHHDIIVESCNFLQRPIHLRPAVLPTEYRKQCIDIMQQWINSKSKNVSTILNMRDPKNAKNYLVQDLQSYVNYFKQETDQSDQLPAMVDFLKTIERSRGNCILDYLPEYEELFRSAGY